MDNITHLLQTSNFAIEAAPLEAEEVGNLLTMLYIEESPPMEIISGDSTDLKTVSQAEAEAVQALLISDTRDSASMSMSRTVPRSSLPYIETRKAPVSEDLVSLCCQYAEKITWSLGVIHRSSAWYTRI